jgi:Niemann-Pick C1 N terminus
MLQAGVHELIATLLYRLSLCLQGCLACAVNLVNFWCGLVCSPQQASFVSIHDPPRALRDDDLTGQPDVAVLQADVVLSGPYACQLHESCKGTAIVGQSTAMQSAVGASPINVTRFQRGLHAMS